MLKKKLAQINRHLRHLTQLCRSEIQRQRSNYMSCLKNNVDTLEKKLLHVGV